MRGSGAHPATPPIRHPFHGSACRASTSPPAFSGRNEQTPALASGQSRRAAERGATRRSATSSTNRDRLVAPPRVPPPWHDSPQPPNLTTLARERFKVPKSHSTIRIFLFRDSCSVHPAAMQPLNADEVRRVVQSALAEDIGDGDVTTSATVPENATARAVMRARESLVVGGLSVAEAVFREVSPALHLQTLTLTAATWSRTRICSGFQVPPGRY